MAKGGRYLNKNKEAKKADKSGKAGKVVAIILLILVLLVGCGIVAARYFIGSMLGNVNRAEYVEKNQDKSYEDLIAEILGDQTEDAEPGDFDAEQTEDTAAETEE